MVQGIGVDIVKLERIEAVHRRLVTALRGRYCPLRSSPRSGNVVIYCKTVCAKEAIAKALGTGFRGGITMPSITINKNSLNKPQVALTGAAAERLRVIGAQQVLVSIADEVDSVVAFAIAQ